MGTDTTDMHRLLGDFQREVDREVFSQTTDVGGSRVAAAGKQIADFLRECDSPLAFVPSDNWQEDARTAAIFLREWIKENPGDPQTPLLAERLLAPFRMRGR